MEDFEIVALYLRRDESAILETEQKYGAAIKALAQNLLGNSEDAEECLNDTLKAAWDSIPPAHPEQLKAWLLGVVRNKAIAIWRRDHAKKRALGLETLLSELDDCVPSAENTEHKAEAAELGRFIGEWLKTQPLQDRILFRQRYLLGESLAEIAASENIKAQKISKRLFLMRKSLRKALLKEELFL